MSNYSRLLAGTSVTWKNTGGDKALTLTSLASAAAREGDKSASIVHGTYGLPEYLEFRLETSMAVAAANGTTIDLLIGESDSSTAGTNNPGNLTGADASWSNPSELCTQLRLAGSLILSNARGTNIQKVRLVLPRPLSGYIIPVIYNQGGQALGSTASDHQLVMTPYYREIG